MPLFPPSRNNSGNDRKPFVPHPAGRWIGVLADVYALRERNFFFGKADKEGEIDERIATDNLYLVFLTEHPTEDGRPSYIRQKFTFSMGDNSKLKRFLTTWVPELAGRDLWKFDIETLLGKGADLSTTIRPKKNDPTHPGFAEILGAMPVRKSDILPIIPSDFKRADVNTMQEKANLQIEELRILHAPKAKAFGDDDLPPFAPPEAVPTKGSEFKSKAFDDDLPFG